MNGPAPAELALPPGRSCPIDYRLRPAEFLQCQPVDCEVLYVAGGLYGNGFALSEIRRMFGAEHSASRRLVFNGDFHWFDAQASAFSDIERDTCFAGSERLRGNVETELARPDGLAGCGCAYPAEVAEQLVERSNRIESRLGALARALDKASALSTLARVARYRVGELGVAITHGDLDSMAGWRLSNEQIDDSIAAGLAGQMVQIDARVIACSHTCLASARSFPGPTDVLAVLNNGSAGMANFSGSNFGLVTRIALESAGPAPIEPCYSATIEGVALQALPVHFDLAGWWAQFEAIWPAGSDAKISYADRIHGRLSHRPEDAIRTDRVRCAAGRPDTGVLPGFALHNKRKA